MPWAYIFTLWTLLFGRNVVYAGSVSGKILVRLYIIECFEVPGKKVHVGEILQRQKDIYTVLDMEVLSSLGVSGG